MPACAASPTGWNWRHTVSTVCHRKLTLDRLRTRRPRARQPEEDVQMTG
jgi:hypothetical protein